MEDILEKFYRYIGRHAYTVKIRGNSKYGQFLIKQTILDDIFLTKLRKFMGIFVKIEDSLGKFYRHIGRHAKTFRHNWKMEVETFSDKTEDFHKSFSDKIEEI